MGLCPACKAAGLLPSVNSPLFKRRATSICRFICKERATKKNSEFTMALRVAMKMGRGSVARRSRINSNAFRFLAPAEAHFGRNKSSATSRAEHYRRYRWAIGIRQPVPNASVVTFSPIAAWRRLYSFMSTRCCIQRTTLASKPRPMMSSGLRCSST
jgi:hypothetical protein